MISLALRRSRHAPLLVFLTLLLPGAVLSPAANAQRPHAPVLRGGALATFSVQGERFRVWVTNPETIGQLLALRAGTSWATIPDGRIFSGPGKAGHNRPWRWHLDSRDIQMVEMTTAACDGTPSYVNAHVRQFVRTVKRYCPWNAELMGLRVIPPIASGEPAAPTNLRVTGVTTSAGSARQTIVDLAWQQSPSRVSGYRIRSTVQRFYGGSNERTEDVPASATTAEVQLVAGGINPTKEACFTVSAFNAARESGAAGPVCVSL